MAGSSSWSLTGMKSVMVTMPAAVVNVVSRMLVSGRYSWLVSNPGSTGPMRKRPPSSWSRMAAKTLGESKRGKAAPVYSAVGTDKRRRCHVAYQSVAIHFGMGRNARWMGVSLPLERCVCKRGGAGYRTHSLGGGCHGGPCPAESSRARSLESRLGISD